MCVYISLYLSLSLYKYIYIYIYIYAHAIASNIISLSLYIYICIYVYMYYIYIYIYIYPEGTNRATSVNVQLPCLRKDPRTGSISRDIVNFPTELCRRGSDMFTAVARLVPPE